MGAAEDLFWDCAPTLYELDDVRESTMFGFRCIRVGDQFVGMPANDRLWVKLPEQRVNELIDAGIGEVCAPAGRPFREWVAVPALDEALWTDLLRESVEFVRR